MNIAEILVFRGVGHTYTYEIPAENSSEYQIGLHVEVPLGNSTSLGLILNIYDAKEDKNGIDAAKIKKIKAILADKPIINNEMIKFIRWFSDYYLITPYKAYQTIFGSMKLRKISSDLPEKVNFTSDFKLTKEQETAIETVLSNGPGKKYMLFGVTASGKTEVYIQLSQKIIQQGKNVIMLLPEIALTPQVRQEFKKRFGDVVAVIHSGLTAKQREIEWNKIYANQIKIVIGPRSALFVPLQNIGLIIVDEEHENTYKQENNPRYFLHSVAEFRAQNNHAIQIYGSATPSIESYFSSLENDQHTLLTLKNRINNQALPKVAIVDMKNEIQAGNNSFLSTILKEKIQEKLAKKEKIIILINRRGFATYISCQKCGSVLTCPKCNLSFTFHKDQKFRCHRCDITMPITNTCPKCQAKRLAFTGFGIQKVELELLKLFPEVRIMRLDRDAIKTTKQLETVLDDFRDHGQILLGTQLVAKGHHFEDVTLVGVLGIDTVLNLPDFRSPERAFQLVTQVAGRSGRAEKAGEVIVQTYQPDHHAIVHASQHDFLGFYEEEIEFRRQLWYPPFCTLINIIISATNLSELQAFLLNLGKFLQSELAVFKEKIKFIGPKPAPIEKIKAFYRYHVLIKAENSIVQDLKKILKNLPEKKQAIKVIIDFDPRSLL